MDRICDMEEARGEMPGEQVAAEPAEAGEEEGEEKEQEQEHEEDGDDVEPAVHDVTMGGQICGLFGCPLSRLHSGMCMMPAFRHSTSKAPSSPNAFQ